jgi:hypothetical protein
MAPAKIPYVFQGPPQACKILYDPNREGQSDEEIRDNCEGTTGIEVLFINETSLANSPQVRIKIRKCQFTAILDSGSEVNLLSERVY